MHLPLRCNFRSVLQRRVRSTLTAAGVAVAVFASVMMIGLARGIVAGTRDTASPDNVIVLSRGADSMEFSALDPADYHLMGGMAGVMHLDGQPLMSPELYLSTLATLPGHPGASRRAVVRGVLPVAHAVHSKFRMVDGSPPRRGFGVAVGRLVPAKLGVSPDSLAAGSKISFEGQEWTVTGTFEAGGTVLEAEIWCQLDDIMVAARKSDYSAVAVKAASSGAVDGILADFATRTDIRTDARSEGDYYAAIASGLKPVGAVAIFMAILLTAGAVMAGMNTMSASIFGRTRELGVLIVLGYRRRAVLLSFVIESAGLCLAGGAVGMAAAWALDGLPMRIPMGAFRFAVDGVALGIGLGLTLAVGVLGASVPLLRVCRLPVTSALRAA